MSGPNTTGRPRTEDYNLGRGILYFALLDPTTNRPLAYRDLGNSPEFNLSIEVETLQHSSSREGLRVVDKEVVISQSLTLNFQLDEINHENLAALFAGEKASHTNSAVAGFASHEAYPSVEQGRWYDIIDANGNRAYDVAGDDLTVEEGTSNTEAVEGVDYELDSEMGRIFIISGSTVLTAGSPLDLTLAANAGASDVSEVRGLTTTNLIGAIKFISENPANNDRRTEYQFHKVSLKSEGDFSLIGDEFTTMGFTAAAEKNETSSPDSPTLTVRSVAA